MAMLKASISLPLDEVRGTGEHKEGCRAPASPWEGESTSTLLLAPAGYAVPRKRVWTCCK